MEPGDPVQRPFVELTERFEKLHELVLRRADAGDTSGMVIEEAVVTLEELQVALAELHDQNTELSAAHDELRLARREYEQLFENAPDPYIVTDAAGVIERANRRARELLGARARELRGKPLVVFLPHDDRSDFRQLVARCTGDDVVAETGRFTLVPREGQPVEVIVNVTRTAAKDQLRWSVRPAPRLVIEDAAEVDAVLSLAAHDLRSPLSVVLGAGETLALHGRTLSDEQIVRLGESVQDAGTRAIRFLDDLLLLTGTFTGSRTAPEQLRLAPFITAVAEAAAAGRVPVEVRCSPPDAAAMLARMHLEHIVQNLVGNAAEHATGASAVTVEVEAFPHVVRISVADDGPGVPLTELDMLFDADPVKRRSIGHGFGLALVQQLSEAHGGGVRYEDVEGGGARFVVTMATDEPD